MSAAGASSTCWTCSRTPTSSPDSPTSSPRWPSRENLPRGRPAATAAACACSRLGHEHGDQADRRRLAGEHRRDRSEAAPRRPRLPRHPRQPARSDRAGWSTRTFAVRDPCWWGDGTACASDSKKFGVLVIEPDDRVAQPLRRARGHDLLARRTKSRVCIYSQVKTCSASEVAAMIEGLLRHCTDAEIDRSTPTPTGASLVGFAFAHCWASSCCHG